MLGSFEKILNTLQTQLSPSATDAQTRADRAPPTDWAETIEPGESAYFKEVVADIRELQQLSSRLEKRPIDRGFHAKPHMIVSGELKVLDHLPAYVRQGVCREPASYQTWVRFSNGQPSRRADWSGDIRGMGVKILGVPGPALTPEEPSFDLLNILQPVQPARDIHQFMGFVHASTNMLTLPFKLASEVGLREASRMLYWFTRNVLTQIPRSLATQNFYTPLPIKWGPYASKVSFLAAGASAASRPNVADPEYLRRDLIDRLQKGPLRWDMVVQFYLDPVQTPIEDATVDWKVSDAPYIKVAELTIPSANAVLAEDAGEQARLSKLSFSPWHAPEAHRPLGSIMRARREAYRASQAFRNANQVSALGASRVASA